MLLGTSSLLEEFVSKAPPRITSPTDDQEQFAQLGQNIKLHCKAQGIPPPDIIWTKSGRVVGQNPILHLENLKITDQGKYVCHASNVEGTDRSATLLHFSQGPIIDYPLTNKTVIEGSNVFWHCAASANPQNMTYRWTKEGVAINTIALGLRAHVQDADFGISKVHREDEGWYECEVSNGFPPSAKSSAFLSVQYKPELGSESKTMYVLGEGSDGQVPCNMVANPPPTNVYWSKNGLVLTDTNQTSRFRINGTNLFFSNATLEDSGMYACWSENVVGRSEVYEMHVIVTAPPVFRKEPPSEVKLEKGEDFETVCDGYGDPPPSQYWLHNMKRIEGKNLKITSASHSDHGDYQCVLLNEVVAVTRNMSVTVRNTKPQCINNLRLNCLTENGFRIDFDPGFDGGHEQKFRLFYTEVQNISGAEVLGEWYRSDEFADSSVALTDLRPFTRYRLVISPSNELGSVNCTATDKFTCSSLNPPSSLRASNEYLEWNEVPYAMSYRVSYQANPNGEYKVMGEVIDNRIHLKPEALDEMASTNFFVQSVRPHYPPSQPSEVITFKQLMPPTAIYTHSSVVIMAVCMLSIILYIFGKNYCKKNKQKKNPIYSTNQFAYKNGNGPCYWESEALYSTDQNGTEFEFDDDGNQIDTSRTTPDTMINEMLRQKYIYSNGNQALGALRENLHIERLRNELRQSVL
ncbi:unnamed protein product [Bursaphelenchus xylophilus]|uniref:(pine wood nematode) hypothetical protein n=1 Tax=Bursaphelenchus xylophilus TaxID=6326 RepID=A0A811KWM3_BURXY|nr:unnamed protein product [Bursaphelenchus xylophilus]CAG9107723.1 unnamed protein product [Bursaphelenchus xylophilus]